MFLGYIDPGTGFTITSLGGLLLAFLWGALSVALVFFKKIFRPLKKPFKKKLWRVLAIVLIMILVGLAGFMFMKNLSSSLNKKIIVIGFDALSPQIIEPLMAEGKLPNFARLKEQGAYQRLQTTTPPQSPVAWAGFATGKNPGKHGVFDFLSRDPQTYKLSLALSSFDASGRARQVLKTKRLWQYLSDKNVPSVILSCPVSFPPDKIKGKMLSGMGVPDILGTEGTFSFYTTEKQPGDETTTGGKVFYLKKSQEMITHLVGPRVQGLRGQADFLKVPLKISVIEPPLDKQGKLNKSDDTVELAYQQKTVLLRAKQWSPWQEIVFDAGFFRKIKGVFKFYVVQISPEIKIYVSPINMDPRAPFMPISYPKSYSRQLAGELGIFHTQGMPFDTWALNENRIDEAVFLEMMEDCDQEREKLLDLELGRFEKGVFFFYFESPDVIQHMFWRFQDATHPLYEPNAPVEYKEMIKTWYVRMDKILGRVMKTLGADDVLLVLSDHGVDSFRRAVNVNTWLRDNGFLELKEASAMQGAPLLKDIDWSKTKAYAAGFNALYINQKGREKEGIVNPGAETEQLKDELIRKLESWSDKKYNTKVVHKVYKADEVFPGPRQEQAPDLIVGYNVGYRASWQTALGDVPREILEDNLRKWAGDHLFDVGLVPGVLFSNRPVPKENPSILDLTPTILKSAGFTDEELKKFNFDGQPLF